MIASVAPLREDAKNRRPHDDGRRQRFLSSNSFIWTLRSDRGLMLCAPIPYALRSDGLIRTNDAINAMTLEQLRTGIL
jgi:hypothetical protein